MSSRPRITIITGISVDGKISPDKHASSKVFDKSISPDAFVPLVELKERTDVVMVGKNTILTDDANLVGNEFYGVHNTIRRLVVDSRCEIPLGARIFKIEPNRTIIGTTEQAPESRIRKIRETGATVIICGKQEVNLPGLFSNLHRSGVKSVMVEGGGELNYSLLRSGLVDELIVVIFPFAVGKSTAPSLLEGAGFPKQLLKLRLSEIRILGENIFVHYVPPTDVDERGKTQV